MNSTDLATFNQAVATAQSGQNQVAHITLTGLSQRYPTDTNVLLWLAFTASNWHTASTYVEKVAQFDPQNPALSGALDWLASQKPVAPPPQPSVVPAFEMAGAGVAVNSKAYSSSAVNYQAEDVVASVPRSNVSQPSQTYNNNSSTAVNYYDDTMPAKSRLFWVKIVGALVALLVAGLIVIAIANSLASSTVAGLQANPAGVADLPAPANVQGLTITGAIQQQFQATTVSLHNPQYGFYLLPSGQPADLLSDYAQQLKGKGWAFISTQNKAANEVFQLYTKSGKVAIIGVYGPLTEQNLEGLSDSDQKLLKAGNSMVFLMEADAIR